MGLSDRFICSGKKHTNRKWRQKGECGPGHGPAPPPLVYIVSSFPAKECVWPGLALASAKTVCANQ